MTAMVLESQPSDLDKNEGAGVEIRTPADFAVAKALKRRELGAYTHGVSYGDIYWNNAEGLAVRRDLIGDVADDEDESDD
jgi:hypothetical protein